MKSLEVEGVIDDQGRLVLSAPLPLKPGKVRVVVDALSDADDETTFRALVEHSWAPSLANSEEDIYTLADGDAIDPMTGEVVREAR